MPENPAGERAGFYPGGMSWLTKAFTNVAKVGFFPASEVLDDLDSKETSQSIPSVVGPTDAEVLASDERLRRAMASQRGRSSSIVSGGLGTGGVRLAMPSLVGTG